MRQAPVTKNAVYWELFDLVPFAIDPHELSARRRPVDQHAGRGHRELRPSVGQWNGLPRHSQPPAIEGRGHEDLAAAEEEMTRCCKCGLPRGPQQERRCLRIQRAEVDSRSLGARCRYEVQKMASVRKKRRAAMVGVSPESIQFSGRDRSATGWRQAEEGLVILAEHDVARRAPVATGERVARRLRFAQDPRRPPGDGDRLELAAGAEADGTAVRRPERPACVLRAFESPRGQGVEPLDPQPGLPVSLAGERTPVADRQVRRQSDPRELECPPRGLSTVPSGGSRYDCTADGAASGAVRQDRLSKTRAIATAALPASHTARRRFVDASAEGAGARPDAAGSSSARRWNARSRADWKRASGSFSRHRAIDRRNPIGASTAISAGSSLRIAAIVSAVVLRANVRWPVTISCSTQPRANRSLRAVVAVPATCSGDM